MGLFDFFKKQSPSDKQSGKQEAMQPTDSNSLLLHTLQERLIECGFQVDRDPHYLSLTINSELNIATAIIDNPNNHPAVLQLLILTIHPVYFPNGIEENIVGVGNTRQDKINSVINNYLTTTFPPIMDSFSDSHLPDLDFFTVAGGKETLWHPKLGDLGLQGQWNPEPENEVFFDIIKQKIKSKLTSNKINWLKMYILKQSDGTITGECLFNNQSWSEGLDDITEYAKFWKMNSNFQGLKQFIVFRRCDAYDE